jgi:hypothetical protein
MKIIKYETQEHKLRLQARANSLKPSVATVIATSRGWEVPQARGTMELLVSFPGLDALLGDNTPELVIVDPIIVVTEAAPKAAPVAATKKPGPKPKVKIDPATVVEA